MVGSTPARALDFSFLFRVCLLLGNSTDSVAKTPMPYNFVLIADENLGDPKTVKQI